MMQGDFMSNDIESNPDYVNGEMGAPITVLWDGILLVPVIGPVDSRRAQGLMEGILERIPRANAKIVIMDILGVLAVDSSVANHLIQIAKATRLMGCDFIISGISPAIAHSMVQLGIDLDKIHSTLTVKASLEMAFEKLKLDVVERKTLQAPND